MLFSLRALLPVQRQVHAVLHDAGAVMAKTNDKIQAILKETIADHGPKAMTDEPYSVYAALLSSKACSRKTAALILYLLASGMDFAALCPDEEALSAAVRKELALGKKAADSLASIMCSLYSDDNEKEWQEKQFEGLSQFLDGQFVCTWSGSATWRSGGASLDCSYDAEIILQPTKAVQKDKELAALLAKNPFLTKDAIHDLFASRLQKHLDAEFEDDCTAEKYYEPVPEDFELEYAVTEWGKENGFDFVECSGDGDTSDYDY